VQVRKINKHDRYVDDLYVKVKGDYDFLYRHLTLFSKKRKVGEADLVGIRGDRVDLYEVKCSYRIHKARKQLLRLQRIFGRKGIALYFYCGSAKQLEAIAD